MLKAQQAALAQATNQGLLGIRQNEISYYTSFSLTFGGQAALIGGFAYAALTQVAFPYSPYTVSPLNYGNVTYDDYLGLPLAPFSGYNVCQSLYWVFSAVCMASAMHCILTTIFVQVLGPGLALHGPLGSMAKAANGMRAEMNQIFYAYIVMVISFALSTLFSFWVLMSERAAIASTVVFAICATQWWRYCSRIYNKLYLDFDSPQLKEQRERDEDALFSDDDEDPTEPRINQQQQNLGAQAAQSKVQPGNTKIFGLFKNQGQPAEDEKKSDEALAAANSGIRKGCSMEGYLTKCDSNGANWTRRYFVLTNDGDLFYYKSKTDFIDNPKSAIKDRPIEISLYDVLLGDRAAGNGVTSAHGYEIRLALKDRVKSARMWVFRCDSLEEFSAWKDSLVIASKM